MKIIYFFIYFLLFIPVYCDLIPNNRVIADSSSANDFNLVEGITYKIVHLRTGLNLDGNSYEIYVNSVSSYWALRKANGNQYNIINVKSGLNLDNNGRRVYMSNPKDNHIFNPYQNWIFKKIKDNIYNIVCVKSGLNLDSNGKDVYISALRDNSKTNIYQQWLFEPSNYNLTAVVMDMKYPPDLKDKLEQYKSRAVLLTENAIIKNVKNEADNAILEQIIDETESKLNSYTLEIKKESFNVTENVDLSFNIGGSIFDLLGIHTDFTAGIKREFSSQNEKVYRESVTESVSYHIHEKITVPPSSSVTFSSTVDKININVPFKAKIRITGKADRLDKGGRVFPMTDVEVNALRCYLSKENYDIKDIMVEGNSILIDTVGTLEVNGYGLDTETRIVTTNTSASLKDYLLYSIILFNISFLLYKLYSNWPNQQNDYQPILKFQ